MNLGEARSHRLWRTLSESKQRYIEGLIESGDEFAAATKAFDLQPQSVRTMVNKLRKDPVAGFFVRAILDGDSISQDEYLQFVFKSARDAKDDSTRCKLLQLFADVKGWREKSAAPVPAAPAQTPEPAEPQSPDVSDLDDIRD